MGKTKSHNKPTEINGKELSIKQILVSPYTHQLLKWIREDIKNETGRNFSSSDELILYIIEKLSNYDISKFKYKKVEQ